MFDWIRPRLLFFVGFGLCLNFVLLRFSMDERDERSQNWELDAPLELEELDAIASSRSLLNASAKTEDLEGSIDGGQITQQDLEIALGEERYLA